MKQTQINVSGQIILGRKSRAQQGETMGEVKGAESIHYTKKRGNEHSKQRNGMCKGPEVGENGVYHSVEVSVAKE